MRKLPGLVLLVMFMTICPYANSGDTLGRDLAIPCTGCHGTEGRSEGAIPPIAGMDKQHFVQLMHAFRNGTRPATVMHQHARGLDDAQIDTIGDYFSGQSLH